MKKLVRMYFIDDSRELTCLQIAKEGKRLNVFQLTRQMIKDSGVPMSVDMVARVAIMVSSTRGLACPILMNFFQRKIYHERGFKGVEYFTKVDDMLDEIRKEADGDSLMLARCVSQLDLKSICLWNFHFG